MGKYTLTEIDGNKLRDILYTKGLTLASASKQLGFSNKFLSETIRRNSISTVGISGLKYVLGIDFDDYKPTVTDKSEGMSKSDAMLSCEYIRATIKRVCGSQAILAKDIGRSESYISAWLCGDTILKTTDIAGISVILALDKDKIPAKFEKEEKEEKESQMIDDSKLDMIAEKLDTVNENLNAIFGVILGVSDTQNREVKYLSHIMRNTRHFETFEETMRKTKADSMTMVAGGGDND